MPTDFIGQEVKLNDWVLFTQLGYRNYWVGKVIKLTPKTVLIQHVKEHSSRTETKQEYSQVVVLTEQQVPQHFRIEQHDS